MSDTKPFDPIMLDRHPAVQVVLGVTQHGKSTYMNLCLQLWRARAPGKSFALDCNAPDPPERKHIAFHADRWHDEAPDELDPDFSLVVCDEMERFPMAARAENRILREAVLRGQHTGRHKTSAILGAQRAVDIPLRVRSQMERAVIFRLQDASDLEWCSKLACMRPDVMALVPHLPPGFAVVWDRRDGIFVPWVPAWQP